MILIKSLYIWYLIIHKNLPKLVYVFFTILFLLYNIVGGYMRQRNVKNKKEIIENSKYYINNCYEYIGKWNSLFQNNNPIYLEIGIGKGKFIIENAIKYPNINFIGIEKYDSILALALKKYQTICQI